MSGRKGGGTGPPPGGSRGGKRKLGADSPLTISADDEMMVPVQKPRLEDDIVGKFLQVVQRTFDKPMVDISSSALFPPLVDLLGEMDGLLSSGESSTATAIGVSQVRRLLALLELVFSEVGAREGDGAPCKKGAVPEALVRLRTTAVGFVTACIQHIHHNLLSSGKGVDALNKALGLLELMTEGIDMQPCLADSKPAILSQLSSQTVSYSMVPLSQELMARITALVFGQATLTPPTTRKSAAALDLKMSHYGPDYELTVQQEREAGCSLRSGQSSLKSHGDSSAGGLAQRGVAVLLDVCTHLLKATSAPRHFAASTAKPAAAVGHEAAISDALMPLRSENEIYGAVQMMDFIERAVRLILAVESETRAELDASNPFPMQGSPAVLTKCLDLAAALMAHHRRVMDLATSLLVAARLATPSADHVCAVYSEKEGGYLLSPVTVVTLENLMSIVALHDADPAAGTSTSLRCYMAGQLLRTFPRAHHLTSLIEEPRKAATSARVSLRQRQAATRSMPGPAPAGLTRFAANALLEELVSAQQVGQAVGTSVGLSTAASETVGEAMQAMGRSSATRAAWLMRQLMDPGSTATGEVVESILAVLIQSLAGERVMDELVTCLFSLLCAVAEMVTKRGGEGVATATLRLSGLCQVARRMAVHGRPSAPLKEAVPSLFKSVPANTSHALSSQLLGCICDSPRVGQQGSWPVHLAESPCVLVGALFSSISIEPSVATTIWEGLLRSIDAMAGSSSSSSSETERPEESAFGLVHVRLLSLIFELQPPETAKAQLPRFTAALARLEKTRPQSPVLMSEALLVIEAMCDWLVDGSKTGASQQQELPWLDIVPTGCTASDALWLPHASSTEPISVKVEDGDSLRQNLFKCFEAVGRGASEEASVSRGISTALRLMGRLPAAPYPSGLAGWREVSEHMHVGKAPPLGAVDRLLHLARGYEAQGAEGDASVPSVKSLLEHLGVAFGEQVLAAERAGPELGLRHGVLEALTLFVTHRVLARGKLAEGEASGLMDALDLMLRAQRVLLRRAVTEIWAACDPATLFEDLGENMEDLEASRARLVKLSVLLLRLGHSAPYLSSVSGNLVAFHKGFSALGVHGDLDPLVYVSTVDRYKVEKQLPASILEGFQDQVALLSPRGDDEDEADRIIKVLMSGIRVVTLLLFAAESMEPHLEEADKARLAALVVDVTCDESLSMTSDVSDGLLSSLIMEEKMEARQLDLIGEALVEAVQEGPSQQMITVLSDAITTHCIFSYAEAASRQRGRSDLLPHFLSTYDANHRSPVIDLVLCGNAPRDVVSVLLCALEVVWRPLYEPTGARRPTAAEDAMQMQLVQRMGAQLAAVPADKLSSLIRSWLQAPSPGVERGLMLNLLVFTDNLVADQDLAGELHSKLYATMLEMLPQAIASSDLSTLSMVGLLGVLAMRLGRVADLLGAMMDCAEGKGVSTLAQCCMLEVMQGLLTTCKPVQEEEGPKDCDDADAEEEEFCSPMEVDDSPESESLPLSYDLCTSLDKAMLPMDPQPWYHCHTCGVSSCCKICAGACHQGHDLSYSCVGTLGPCGCVKRTDSKGQKLCKCLEPEKGHEGQQSSSGIAMRSRKLRSLLARYPNSSAFEGICRELLALGSISSATRSTNTTGVEAVVPTLLPRVSALAQSLCRAACEEVDPSPAVSSASGGPKDDKTRRLVRTALLRLTCALPSGTLDCKPTADGPRSRQLKTVGGNGQGRRQILTCDGQGRLAFAEQDHVLIASAIPLLIDSQKPKPNSTAPQSADRARLSVLSKSAMSFQIAGLLFNPACPVNLLVWGARDCVVLSLSPTGTVSRRSVLDPCFDTVNFSGLVKSVQWVPGSSTHVCVVTETSVRVLDFTRSSNQATHNFRSSGSGDHTIIDAALVPSPSTSASPSGGADDGVAPSLGATLIVLTKAMRLYRLRLSRPCTRPLVTIESRVESGVSIGFPSPPLPQGYQEDGPYGLHYSEANKLFLCAWDETHVLAFRMDEGLTRVENAHWLLTGEGLTALPHMSPQGDKTWHQPFEGPFTRWVDWPSNAAGDADDGKERPSMVLVGRMSRQRGEAPLVLQLSDPDTLQVDELRRRVSEGALAGDGMIEGVCVMPSVGGLGPALLVLYENGCLQIYGPVPSSSPDASVVPFDKRGSEYHAGTAAREILQRRAAGTGVADQQGHTNGMASLASVDASHELQQWHTQGPSRAEKMTEVTKWTSLSILGDGVRESSRSEPILSPGNVGTTIAIRLESRELEIAVVRVRVGSSSLTCIPSSLRLFGRTRVTRCRFSRWYDLVLSSSERALARACGAVFLGIGPSWVGDAVHVVVDAIEVYAQSRFTYMPSPVVTRRFRRTKPDAVGDVLHVLTRMVGVLHRKEAEPPAGAFDPVLSAVELTLCQTWGREDRDDMLSVREAAKELLTELYPDEDMYNSQKDRIYLTHVSGLLDGTPKPGPTPTNAELLATLRSGVQLGMKVLNRRHANLYAYAAGKDGRVSGPERLFFRNCVDRLVQLATSANEGSPFEKELGAGAGRGGKLEEVAGDLVEIALRELVHVVGKEGTQAAVLLPALKLLMPLLDCPTRGLTGALVARVVKLVKAARRKPSTSSSSKGDKPLDEQDWGMDDDLELSLSPTRVKSKAAAAETALKSPGSVEMELDYRCDGCDMHPLIGVRWHCQECPDFDLCHDCYRSGVRGEDGHEPSHAMSRFTHPNWSESGEEKPAADGKEPAKGNGEEGGKAAGGSSFEPLLWVVERLYTLLIDSFPQALELTGVTGVSVRVASDSLMARLSLMLALVRSLGGRTLSERASSLAHALAKGFAAAVKQFTSGPPGRDLSRSAPLTDNLILLSRALQYLLSSSLREKIVTLALPPICTDHHELCLLYKETAGGSKGKIFYGCPVGDCGYSRFLDPKKRKFEDATILVPAISQRTRVSLKSNRLGMGGDFIQAAVQALFTHLPPGPGSTEALLCDLLSAQLPGAPVVAATLFRDSVRHVWPCPGPPSSGFAFDSQSKQLQTLFRESHQALGASLLLALAALRKAAEAHERPATQDWSAGWIPFMCKLIEGSPAPASFLKSAAKRFLRALCGSRAEYQRRRDWFVMNEGFKTMVKLVRPLLLAEGHGRMAVEDLPYAEQVELRQALNRLLSVAQARSANWRHYAIDRGAEPTAQEGAGAEADPTPVCLLFDLCPRMDEASQHICLSLLELATSSQAEVPEEAHAVEEDDEESSEPESEGEEAEDDEEEGAEEGEVEEEVEGEAAAMDVDPAHDEAAAALAEDGKKEGEEDKDAAAAGEGKGEGEEEEEEEKPGGPVAVLVRAGRLTGPVLMSWIQAMVLTSKLHGIRHVCGLLLPRLYASLPPPDKAHVRAALIARLGQLPHHGSHAEEVLLLLDHVAASRDLGTHHADLARVLTRALQLQLSTLENHPYARLYQLLDVLVSPPQYYLDPSPCPSCIRSVADKEAAYRLVTLDSLKSSQRSTETTHMVAFKTRQRIRRLSLKVHEPHGRLVKIIRLSYHPRTVASLAELQVPENYPKWQRLTSITLSVGQVTVDVDLVVPVVAGCLLVEYDEFHLTGSLAPSKASMLHCPQCGRQVADPHGVCRHCGEVAFQCRQCRHINYERLDGFLCVECGYCAYGQFSYRLFAAPASEATPISTPDERDAALKQHAVLSAKLQDERQKLASTVPELARLIHDMDAARVPTPPSSVLMPTSAELAVALSSDIGSERLAGMDKAVRASMGGSVMLRPTEEEDKPPAPLARTLPTGARFVFVTEGVADLETESRDGDEDDMTEDGEEPVDPESSRSGAGGSQPEAPPPASLLDTLEGSTRQRPSLFRNGALVDLPGPGGATSIYAPARSTATASGGAQAGAGSGLGLSRLHNRIPAARASAQDPLYLARQPPSSAPTPSAPVTTAPRAKASYTTGSANMQKVVDYYTKTCRTHHDKIVESARDLLSLTDELVAHQRAHTDPALLAEDEEDDAAHVTATSCYSCATKVTRLLLQTLLTLASRGRCQEAEAQGLLPFLLESVLVSQHPDIRMLGRQLLCAVSASADSPGRQGILRHLERRLRQALDVGASEEVLSHHLLAIYDLCTLDLLPPPSATPSRSQVIQAWRDHLTIPVELLRSAAAAGHKAASVTTSLLMPCLELVASVVAHKYPGVDVIDEIDVHKAAQTVTTDLLRDLLQAEAQGTSSSTQGGWVTVGQQRRAGLVAQAVAKLRKGKGPRDASSCSALVSRAEGESDEAMWWMSLLLNPHSVEVRKCSALLLLEALRATLGDHWEDGPEDEEEDCSEAEDDEDHEEEDEDEGEEAKEEQQEAETKEEEGEWHAKTHHATVTPSLTPARVMDLLMAGLSLAPPNAASWQLFGLLRHLAGCHARAAFLVVRGAVPFLETRIRAEVQRLKRMELRAMSGLTLPCTSDCGEFLLQLVEVLAAILAHEPIRRRCLRRHMSGLLRTLLTIKLEVTLQTSAVTSALSILQNLTRPPKALPSPPPPMPPPSSPTAMAVDSPESKKPQEDSERERRMYLKASAELVKEYAQDKGVVGLDATSRSAVVFLLQNMSLTIDPPKLRCRYRIHFRRSPSQEEFFRGSLSRNPIWVTDVPLCRTPGSEASSGEREPLMRDLRALIAKELDIPDATDLLELLVTGKIVNMNVPIRLVWEQLWKPYVIERHPDDYGSPDLSSESFPAVMVTYRLAGVDGEATEEVVETLTDTDEAANAGASAELKYHVTSVLQEGNALSLLLELGRPPSAPHTNVPSPSEEAWQMSVLATTLLQFCSRVDANRQALLQAHAPATLLTYLLTVLRLSSAGDGPASELTDRLLKIIAELGGGAQADTSWQPVALPPNVQEQEGEAAAMAISGGRSTEEEEENQAVALIDHLADGALVEALKGNPFLTRAVARLLPFLTYGREAASRALADRIHADMDWAVVDGSSSASPTEGDKLRLSVVVESLAGLQTDLSASSRLLRDMLLHNGFTAAAVATVCQGLPSGGIQSCVAACQDRGEFLRRKEKIEEEWQAHLTRPALVQGLRVLTGLSSGHVGTQQLLIDRGLLAVLHDIEEIVSSGEAGSLAEVLMELLEREDTLPQAGQVIKELRRTTREHKRRLAQQNRDRTLQAMGISQAATSNPTMQNEFTQMEAGEVGSVASAETSKPPVSPVTVATGASLPMWMSEMEGLEEEDGLTCMVCQEGYSFKPKEVLGMYVYSKSLGSLDATALEGDALVSAEALSPAPSGGSSALRGESMGGSSSRLSRRSCRVVTTVTAFNLIHFTCHAEACKADRALRQPKSEWDGAALRNSRVSCNGMLPIRGPSSMDEAYRIAIEKYFTRLCSVAQQTPVSRFGMVVHDIRLLLMRLGFQESLRDDCGGGSLGSNVRLLPYHAQLGHYVLERVADGDDAMGQKADIRRLDEALRTFITRAGALDVDGKGRPPEHANELQEAASFMPVLATFLLSREEWVAARKCFVRTLLIHAGVRKGRGDMGSGACAARRRSRSIVSTTSEGPGGGKKRRRSMSEGSESDWQAVSQLSQAEEERRAAKEAARPWLMFLCLLDDLNKAFKPEGGTWSIWGKGPGALYSDDEKNCSQSEALAHVYERELGPEETSGAPSRLLERLGYQTAASESGGSGSSGVCAADEEITRLVRFGQNIFG